MILFDLKGRVAIVTGGNRGIGFAVAGGLAKAGAAVVIANRNADAGQKAALTISNKGFKATAVSTDVSEKSSVANLVTRVVEDFGRIDILVNSAGVIDRGPVEEFSETQYDYIMDINLKGLFFCCQLVGKEMIKRGRGKIINISSNVSEVIQAGRVVYAASKAGVSHLTRGLALEWARHNINVNAIGPGPTITELNRKYFEDNPADLQERIDSIPMARVGDPQDLVGAAIFLASDASSYVTGQTLLVDGGSTIW
ncbi:Oxidoreductase, short-chain dehydrogenase/reductase family [Olavius sp. associated proteobacterium Delta 1]|nr:Oxidoreductase, short-chain dehydrogenase/reductase family [Olavius sp. associated proteobacterium Delta 1]